MQGRAAIKLGRGAAGGGSLLSRRTSHGILLPQWRHGRVRRSGDRTPIFISLILIGAIASGYMVRSITAAVAAYTVGIVALLSLFYSFCNPEVCYSTGVDGLEPVRLGYFFTCLCIGGISGNYTWTKVEPRGPLLYILSAVTISVMAYYPVVFTIAGTRLIAPLDPLPVLAIVALPSVVFVQDHKGERLEARHGGPRCWRNLLLVLDNDRDREAVPSTDILPGSLVPSDATLAAGIGCLVVRRSRSCPCEHLQAPRPVQQSALRHPDSALLDGRLPARRIGGSHATAAERGRSPSPYAIGPTVYAGGFATQSIVRPAAVSVTVSFAGTNASSIESDNFLSLPAWGSIPPLLRRWD